MSVHCFRRSPFLNNDLEVVPNATARAIVSPSSKSSSYAQPASYKRSLALQRYVHALNCSKAKPPTSKLSGRFHAPQYWPRWKCSHSFYFLNINKVSLLPRTNLDCVSGHTHQSIAICSPFSVSSSVPHRYPQHTVRARIPRTQLPLNITATTLNSFENYNCRLEIRSHLYIFHCFLIGLVLQE